MCPLEYKHGGDLLLRLKICVRLLCGRNPAAKWQTFKRKLREKPIDYNYLIQWSAIIIELIGLILISVELYFPKTSEFLKATFEETKPKFIRNQKAWIASFILIWIAVVVGLSAWDHSMLLVANLFFSAVTVLVLIVLSISKVLVRLGVALGRGNSVGGVGLVLALIGFSMELVQFI